MRTASDPHAGQPVRYAGAPLERARAAVVLVHGRGATAESILELGVATAPPDLALVAPQAAGGTWYPLSFLAPIEGNEPHLTSALEGLARAVAEVEAAGLGRERIVLAGFSQGACLASEFAAESAGRWGGLVVLSGGLIGPPGTPRDYAGSFAGTPVFIGCSDVDPHIPLARVRETAAVFEAMGADVDARIYPGFGHAVNRDELEAIRALVVGVGRRGTADGLG